MALWRLRGPWIEACHASLLAATICVCTQTAVASKLRRSYINGTVISSTVGHSHALRGKNASAFYRLPLCKLLPARVSLSDLLSVLLDPSSLFDRICRSFELLLHFCTRLGLGCLHSGEIISLSISLEIRLQIRRWFPIWDMKLFIIRSENLRRGLWQWYSSRFLSYPVWEGVELRNVLLKTYRILIEEFATIFKLH